MEANPVTTNKLYPGAFYLSGLALLASDHLAGLSGACLVNRWTDGSAGKAYRSLLYRVSSATYDAKRATENFRQLGAAAVYPVQHGDGVHLGSAALYESK